MQKMGKIQQKWATVQLNLSQYFRFRLFHLRIEQKCVSKSKNHSFYYEFRISNYCAAPKQGDFLPRDWNDFIFLLFFFFGFRMK